MNVLAHPLIEAVDCWIFYLDNTLYPASIDLFALIDQKMGAFISNLLDVDAAEARRIQKRYFLDHGTTLAGLMHHHDTEPRAFLDFVHDIALDRLEPDMALNAHIRALPGRRIIYTNGDIDYAGRVLAKLDLADAFEQVHDIHACNYVPKPDPAGYAALCQSHDVDPARAAFFEDMARNLKPAKALGMATVWINNGSEAGNVGAHPDFIDYETPDLGAFLATIHRNGQDKA